MTPWTKWRKTRWARRVVLDWAKKTCAQYERDGHLDGQYLNTLRRTVAILISYEKGHDPW